MNKTQKAVLHILFYSFCSATLAANTKFMLGTASILQILFYTYLSAFFFYTATVALSKQAISPLFLKQNIFIQILKSISGLLQLIFIFLAFKSLPITTSLVLRGTAPIFVPFFSFYFLSEDKYKTKWVAILICFFGVLILLDPHQTRLNYGILFALLSAITMAINIVLTSKLNKLEELKYRTIFYTLVVPTIILSTMLFLNFKLVPLNIILHCILNGFLLILTLYLFVSSYQEVSAKFIAPFTYSIFIISFLYDILLWADKPNIFNIVGAIIILYGCFLNSKLNKQF